ncbi:MAG: 30S ribosomal protein S4 [Phycisphaerales bacterium]|nr:MAG: 30S ribosomal protein S4 [Phycisphaerales bacterium]
MARYIGPACRLCRRETVKLMLKGARCETAKCAMERQWRNRPPGMHSWRRRRASGDYAVRLREKQKVKRYYGVLERQFLIYFRMAERMKGNTGEALLGLLERRLDNVVWKLGFAPSHRTARIAIAHGHIYVNGRRLNRPSYLVNQGDRIGVKPSERSQKYIRLAFGDGGPTLQSWLQVDAQNLEGTVVAMPAREDVQIPVEEQLIIEMCSR